MSPSSQTRSATPTQLPPIADSRIDVGLAAPLNVRVYGTRSSGSPLVVHFHGGAFVSGSLDSGAAVANLLLGAGAVVMSVDYPLAPAHPFPAPVDAAYAALQWAYRKRAQLAGQGASVFVAGEEAGGNIAAAIALMARDRHAPRLAGQILLSAMLDPCLGTASVRRSEQGPAGCPLATGWCSYLREPANAEHPYAIPGRSLRLADLPPALLITAEDDPLRDETLAYARRLRAAGVPSAECVLPAPSAWPDALLNPAVTHDSWSEPVRTRIHEFLIANRAARPAGHEPASPGPL
ncbi:alpha/beta hydrolase [Azoarcus sp. KH32C]|uniref:alpha/beta hydrolase n=1 Tax=Azoarcus sp. KH32C TaxID=748247 RepID=UPI0002386B80|nr:alpha/beta hydrolase [Azoarcus sp. KH32C]BAL24886.1 alpha/beta hydrolase fold [Azoarcus sp. KH32C]